MVLRIEGKQPKFESILDAATIAAYYSGGRGSGRLAVDYTAVKNLRKPKGARPGMVTYFHQKTVFVITSYSIHYTKLYEVRTAVSISWISTSP